MNVKPLVSVIMPLYNAEKYVGEAIQSIIDQTYTHWELLIVNDGSTDNSLEVAQKYQSDKIKVFSQENKGQCAANNFGFAQSKGDYIKFFDADDVISANMLKEQLNLIIEDDLSIASSQWGRFYNDEIASFKLNPEECWQDMKPVDWICSSWRNAQPMMQCALWLIPRKILDKSGLWDERLSLINDFEFFTRVILSSENIKFCSHSTLFYRSGLGEKALSGQKSRKAVKSAILSARIATDNLLFHLNISESRNICANCLMTLVYDFGLEYPDLILPIEDRINELGGCSLTFPGGKVLKFISNHLGWKTAKIIKNKFLNIWIF